MGRSAKFAKRPTKAEKVARTINKPLNPQRQDRSISPEDPSTTQKSEIPLFNTSAKGRQVSSKPDPRKVGGVRQGGVDDEDGMREDGEEEEESGSTTTMMKKGGGGGGKRSLKDKVRQAKETLDQGSTRTDMKLGAKREKGGKTRHVLGGKDYVKMLESRPGGAYKHKKFR